MKTLKLTETKRAELMSEKDGLAADLRNMNEGTRGWEDRVKRINEIMNRVMVSDSYPDAE